MEISNEIRAKVFVPYIGQMAWEGESGMYKHPECTHLHPYQLTLENFKDAVCGFDYLILKSLSAITDEDAIELAKRMKIGDLSDDKNLLRIFKNGQNITFEHIMKDVLCYQYLQSKGYDLPNFLLGGKTLQKSGLAIYEN